MLLEVVRLHGDYLKMTGRLIIHSAHRDDLREPHARAAAERPGPALSEWFTGETIPAGVVVIL